MSEVEIIEKVGKLFYQFGVKSLTMDDISRKLGISKKTLYQYVSNKKDLVKKVVKSLVEEQQHQIIELTKQSNNAIDRLISVHQFVGSRMNVIHQPMLIFDLQKYHPEALGFLKSHKDDFIFKGIVNNIKQGIEEGYYRTEIKAELIGKFYMGMVTAIARESDKLHETYSKEEVLSSFINYHLRGVLSAKGIDYMKTIEKDEN